MRVEPLQSIRNSLRSGMRLGFPVSRTFEDYLDHFTGLVQIPNIQVCVVLKNGEFNNARLSDGTPHDPTSLIGIVHRVLVNAGENPTWSRHEKVYKSLLDQGDCLEVRL